LIGEIGLMMVRDQLTHLIVVLDVKGEVFWRY